jgi:hypothetical protein
MGFKPEQTYKRKPHTGPPMDLANMRQNGVHDLTVRCLSCLHEARVNVDRYPGHLAVPSFARRMVCTSCGSRNVDVRPAWRMPTPGR